MVGCWWFFGEDEYGTEKFMFECRANEDYLSGFGSKTFWFILFIYTIFPIDLTIVSTVSTPFAFIDMEGVIQ